MNWREPYEALGPLILAGIGWTLVVVVVLFFVFIIYGFISSFKKAIKSPKISDKKESKPCVCGKKDH